MSARYVQAPGCLAREVEGETLIVPAVRAVVDLDDVFYYLGDPVSTRVWELLAEPRTLSDLVAAITTEFQVETPTARADVERFVDELLRAGAACRT